MGGKSGGGGQQTTQTQTSTKIPEWLETAAQGAVGQAQDLSQRAYTPYGGQIVAGTTPDSQQAYDQVRAMQGQGQGLYDQSAAAYQGMLGQAQPQTADQINQLSNSLYGNYQQQVMNPAQGLFGSYLQNAGPATAQMVTDNALQIMDPYSRAVLDPALQMGRQELAKSMQGIAGQANNVGAFGGSRQGVQEGVATAQQAIGAGQLTGDLLQKGWGMALTPAYNLANQASTQGYNAANLMTQLGQQGYQNAQGVGQGIANTNLSAGLNAAQNLPGVATAQQKANQLDASLLQTTGAAQQQQAQQQLAAQMGQWYEGQDWPVQNLNILLGALGGVPYGTDSSSLSTGPKQTKNAAGGAAGGALSGAAMGTAIMPGWGTAIGAVAGGLLGGLG